MSSHWPLVQPTRSKCAEWCKSSSCGMGKHELWNRASNRVCRLFMQRLVHRDGRLRMTGLLVYYWQHQLPSRCSLSTCQLAVADPSCFGAGKRNKVETGNFAPGIKFVARGVLQARRAKPAFGGQRGTRYCDAVTGPIERDCPGGKPRPLFSRRAGG